MAGKVAIPVIAGLLFCVVGIGVGIGIGYGIFHKKSHESTPTPSTITTTTTAPPRTWGDYQRIVDRIIDQYVNLTINKDGMVYTPLYDDLASHTDDQILPRYFGSQGLEDALDRYKADLAIIPGVEVWVEEVAGEAWSRFDDRSKEWARFIEPRNGSIRVLGWGRSASTNGSISAEVTVITDIDAMDDVDGQIVVFNPGWVSYEHNSMLIQRLPSALSHSGALAVLFRSPTPFSTYSVHAGQIHAYNESTGLTDIPMAAVTVEDAEMLTRMQDRGQYIEIELQLEFKGIRTTKSRNIIAEIKGTSKPDEIVLISAHSDSWDISHGVMDDGAGVFLCMHTMKIIADLKPARTVRAVLFTGEEVGLYGAEHYFENHKHEKHVFVFESDMALFKPAGLTVATRSRTGPNMDFYERVVELFGAVADEPEVYLNPYSIGEDVQKFIQRGVPGASLFFTSMKETWSYYLTFHHTEGDSVSQLDRNECQESLAVWAGSVFVIADSMETTGVYETEMRYQKQSKALQMDTLNETLPFPQWYPFELRGHDPHIASHLVPWPSPSNESEFNYYDEAAEKLYDIMVKSELKGKFFERLANITDTFGPRLAGSEDLTKAIHFAKGQLEEDGFDNVGTEAANLPHWIRGKDYAHINSPHHAEIPVLALGGTPSTDPEHHQKAITAEVIVVKDIPDLKQNHSETDIKGKIVVFAPEDWIGYGYMSLIRVLGANASAGMGAVAALVRSATPRGVYLLHGGMQIQTVKHPIPTAAITVEDADMLRRLYHRGKYIEMTLRIQSHEDKHDVISYNTVAEIQGGEKPEEIVLISGHFDSWDVGEGAMDDGVGAVLCWHSMRAIKMAGLKPKRTIRMVMWTDEEMGGIGSSQYYNDHKNESIVFASESDFGVFKPGGLLVATTSNVTLNRIKTILDRFGSRVNATQVYQTHEIGTDVNYWTKRGVPGMTPFHHDFDRMYDYYFTFHHSMADTMTVLKSDHLDEAAYLWAITTFIIADAEVVFE